MQNHTSLIIVVSTINLPNCRNWSWYASYLIVHTSCTHSWHLQAVEKRISWCF